MTNKEELLRREGIDNLPESVSLLIVDHPMTLAAIRDAFIGSFKARNAGQEPAGIAMADRARDDGQAVQAPEGVLFLEYNDVAGPWVYYALCAVILNPDPETLKHWRDWLKNIEPNDLEQLRRELEEYEKVLMAA